MIRNIQIDNLFGRFNYNISTKIEGITIITGPNGFGKSTILRIINALSKGSIDYFMRLDFSSLQISFDNDLLITQGHDFLYCFQAFCESTKRLKGKSPSVEELFRALLCSCHPNNFSEFQLYQSLISYQATYNLLFLPS